MKSEDYTDIVWGQFKKNRLAYYSLWLIGFFFLIAILAPVLASKDPFYFKKDGEIYFPWFVALFNPDSMIDFIFNVALILLLPWVLLTTVLNRSWKRREVSPIKRGLRSFFLLLALLVVVVPALYFAGPPNKYFAHDFRKDHFDGKGSGVYTLIPYGPTEPDDRVTYRSLLFKKTQKHEKYYDHQIHLLGTDNSGRDVLTRMLYGARISLTIGFVAVLLYITIGIIVGAMAGYFGGKVDMLISRIVEVVMLFPAFFLILTLVALMGKSIYIVMVVIGITGWPTISRLIRGEFLRQRAQEYVTAARALGASHTRLMFRHILPNALSPAFVAAPFGIAGAVVTEAGLSVLGFGVNPPTPTWGSILNLAVGNYQYWWYTLTAGVFIFITVTAFNLCGNGLRDAMDPRLRI